MMGVLRKALHKLTPWYDEDEVQSREARTDEIVKKSARTQKEARSAMLESYRDVSKATGR